MKLIRGKNLCHQLRVAGVISLLAVAPTLRAQQSELSAVVRVRTATVAAIPVATTGQVTGQVAAYRKATVAAEVPGRIIERLVEAGTQAQADQLIIRIDTARAKLNLQQNQAVAQARQVDLAHARHEYQRSQRLFKRNVISQDNVDDLRFAQQSAQAQLTAAQVQVATAAKSLADTQVRAPFAGQIEIVHVQVGDYVNPGQAIATLTDFSQARVIAGVSSSESTRITHGAQAQVVFNDLGGLNVSGVVTSIGRIKDQLSGTYPIELMISNKNSNRLREGMVATVAWSNQQTHDVPLSIPSSALLRTAGMIGAYVVDNNYAELRQIRIGHSDGQRVQVMQGLNIGEQVVIEGLFAIRDGAQVEAFSDSIVPVKMAVKVK